MRCIVIASLLLASPAATFAHPGGLAGDGCHNDSKRGGRHCHGGGRAQAARPMALRSLGAIGVRARAGGAFANCSAARAAGAAPVRRGDSGYGSHLDRDGDGVGCE
jgi:hypothetical protein